MSAGEEQKTRNPLVTFAAMGFVVLIVLPNRPQEARWLSPAQKDWIQSRIDEDVAAAGPAQSRTAVRATTPDRLPLAGAAGPDGLFVLGGLGSRGLCAAPLLAEHVAALAAGASSPLPSELAARVAPLRQATGRGLVQPDSM